MILQFSAHAGSMKLIGQKGKASEVDKHPRKNVR